MIDLKYLHYKAKSTRTYKYKLTDDLAKPFKKVSHIRILYFNYALQYLYQHYGVKHLQTWFPDTSIGCKYLINKLKIYARSACLDRHEFDLKKLDYSVQSIDKYLAELLTAFRKYRKAQYKVINYWSDKGKRKYLNTHDCNLTGYYRISYKHDLNEIKSATFKQQRHYNKNKSLSFFAIELLDNHTIKIPYFGIVHTKRSMNHVTNKQIVEVKIVKHSNNDFILHVVIKFVKNKNLTKTELTDPRSMDLNSKDNQFFYFDTNQIYSWSNHFNNRLKKLDWQYRQLSTQLNQYDKGRDCSNKSERVIQKIDYLKAKISNLVKNWQLNMAKQFASKYPVLIVENLQTFKMRLSKRSKIHKLVNHKLAIVQPGTFIKQLSTVYQNQGKLLITVDPYDTSKMCSVCHYIYQNLKVGQKNWLCPNCHIMHQRDHNATINIKNFALNPAKHPVLRQKPYLQAEDLVTYY